MDDVTAARKALVRMIMENPTGSQLPNTLPTLPLISPTRAPASADLVSRLIKSASSYSEAETKLRNELLAVANRTVWLTTFFAVNDLKHVYHIK